MAVTLDRTVGEMVAELPSRSRIFQAHQIDFCCQGNRTVREACQKRGLDPIQVADELDSLRAGPQEPESNPAELPPDELTRYIVRTFHDPLRLELPRLRTMAQRVAQVHGERTPSLHEVLEVFLGLEAELTSHMMKEERVLFPAVEAAVESGYSPIEFEAPIGCMLHEHEDAGRALARLHELTEGFTPPVDACNTYRALFAGLAELEESLHRHIHLENSVLFPEVQQMRPASGGGRITGPALGQRGGTWPGRVSLASEGCRSCGG